MSAWTISEMWPLFSTVSTVCVSFPKSWDLFFHCLLFCFLSLLCWLSRWNFSLRISDYFSPALLTTLKNRYLKAFCGSPTMLWPSCRVNWSSLPRGRMPHCWGPGGREACVEMCTTGCSSWQLGVHSLGSATCRVPAFGKGHSTRLLAHQQGEPGQGSEAAPSDMNQIQPDTQLFFF